MSAPDDALGQALSAVMDGSATPAEWRLVEAAWAADPGLRERWALWHAAGDGLRSAELLALHRDPWALLDALHAQMPASTAEGVAPRRRRDWLAPFAVAAGFVAVAVGVSALRTPAGPDETVAAAPLSTPRAQGLVGLSFAQTAAGRTLPDWSGAQDSGLPTQAPPEIIDWGLSLPEPAASRSAP